MKDEKYYYLKKFISSLRTNIDKLTTNNYSSHTKIFF